MQIIDNLSIFQALVFILTNESIIKQKRNITRTTLTSLNCLQETEEFETSAHKSQSSPNLKKTQERNSWNEKMQQ